MDTIHLNRSVVDDFLRHAAREYPHECCGFIIGTEDAETKRGLEYLPATNTKDANRERRFLIDPLAYQEAEDIADERGLSIISIVHSHPDHPDEPSEFDRDHAWPGFSYIIVSVANGKTKNYRSWQLTPDR
ncbi:MAG: M67 family metallopeptidase, partial [FCB group bacterium]|nr:M67 family metallopeptidase [FCB group bacterium]